MMKSRVGLTTLYSSLLLSISLILGGCGVETLDGSSETSLMETYSKLRDTISQDKVGAFDLAFQQGKEKISELRQKNPGRSQEELRNEVFSNKTPQMLIEDAKLYVDEKIGALTSRMKNSIQCTKSYEDGLKMSNIRMRNSVQSPDKRIEVTFDLQNSSNYPIRALQVDINLEVFGSLDYEAAFIGDKIARCNTKSIINPGESGKFTCLLNYRMDNLTFDGPVEDLQVFKAKIYNNDSNLLDGKEEENSYASCRAKSEEFKIELNTYKSYHEQLAKYR